MGMKLTGNWKKNPNGGQSYESANTGLALVESEVADVFALRLKMRGAAAPLVAYQMRPNPDIPKDRTLISFLINSAYTKQGCLDEKFGMDADKDYPLPKDAPKDASYYKPLEAYVRLAEMPIAKLYPSIRSQQRFYGQLLDLLADYIGVD